MATSEHPSIEDLLLWQSGELSPERAAEVAAHVAACAQCRGDLSETGELFGDIASINAEAAQWKMFKRLDAEQPTLWLARIIGAMQRGWIPATASVLIVALVLYTLSDLTPAARADALLEKAVQREDAVSAAPHFVSLNANGLRCLALTGNSDAHLLTASSPSSCTHLSERLQQAGWTYNDVFSAKGFQRWRSMLKKKRDTLDKSTEETELTTSAEGSIIRRVTLRLRNADLRPVAESLEFAAVEDEPASTIQIAEAPQPTIATPTEPLAPASNKTPHEVAATPPIAGISPLDMAEAHALLALHDAGAESNALIAVEREADTVRVWGVAASDAQKAAITAALSNDHNVVVAVQTASEARQPLPWQPYRGDGPPLAQDQLQALFADSPQRHQAFVNSLDQATLQLVAEARNRDALLPLATRLSLTPTAAQVNQAAQKIEQQITAQSIALAHQLQPLIGSVPPGKGRLSYPQAVELYTLVHQVAYMSNSHDPVVLDDALDRIRRLLAMR